MLINWFGTLGYVIATFVVVYACLKTLKASPSQNFVVVWLQLVVYYSRYWALWLLVWTNWQILNDNHAFFWLISALSLLYLYMVWIEPNRLRIRYQTIDLTQKNQNLDNHSNNNLENNSFDNTDKKPLKIAVLGDIHFGIFHHRSALKRWVLQLNRLDVDAVLFTGDWLYHAGADIVGQMRMVKAINKPCFTTMSQADFEQGKHQPDIIRNVKLTDILPILGVQILHNHTANLDQVQLFGVSADNGAMMARLLEKNAKNQQPSIILTHDIKNLQGNAQLLAHLNERCLVIAGQTHGGQMNVKGVTPKLVKAMTGSRYLSGFYIANYHLTKNTKIKKKTFNTNNYQVWINTGIGMIGLPFRLNCPPQIDVLSIKIKKNKNW